MSYVIKVYRDPKIIAWCNEVCYNGHVEHCDCICIGHCHGHGLAIAKTKVLENWIQIIASIQDQYPEHTHVVLFFPLASTVIPNINHTKHAHRNGKPGTPPPADRPAALKRQGP